MSSPPTSPPRGPDAPEPGPAPRRGLQVRAWNLLLLVPLIALITPLFNLREPALGGLPFFYWFQIAVIPLGIVATVTVHLMTRDPDEDDR